MKRFMILATIAAMAVSVMAQVGNVRKAIELDGVVKEETKAMLPDTVMPNGEWQRVVQSEMTAKDGFKYMRLVLAKMVPDYQHNVQLEDTTDCKLVVTAAVPILATTKYGTYTSLLEGLYDMTLSLVMKDNRYRISCEPVKCVLGVGTLNQVEVPMTSVSKDTDGSMQRDLRWKAGQLVALIDKMLRKQKEEDDF